MHHQTGRVGNTRLKPLYTSSRVNAPIAQNGVEASMSANHFCERGGLIDIDKGNVTNGKNRNVEGWKEKKRDETRMETMSVGRP